LTDIAIVGMDCRFPGAGSPAELWDLLMRGGDGIADVPPPRWPVDELFDPDGGPGTTNTRSAGFIADPDVFDHEFFGFSEEEAAKADPQVRLLLHTAWRAIEDACLDPYAQARSRTGVYVGIMNSDWLSLITTNVPSISKYAGSGNGYSMMANRISYALDLAGPSMAIDTFCSSSLVATQYACTSLRAGDIDQALVGGVSVLVTPSFNIFITQAGLSAPDGRCKPFSARADGFGRAEGVAVVVLRRLADAVADGLPIYAVIKDGAVNHGGRASTPTAPSPRAQQEVISEAYRRAGIGPQDVTFLEAHATGTLVGDRMEARALGRVHGVPRARPCAVGSIKGNIAHAEGAAGVASLIKTALALHHGVVPPSRYADTENPRLRLAENGLTLIREPLKLPAGDVFAGISSFGLGGTNVHLVLASAPHRDRAPARQGGGLLTVSSNTVAGLRTAVRGLAADLADRPEERVAELCWTSNTVKSSGEVRFALPVTGLDQALSALYEAVTDDARLAGLSGRRGERVSAAWLLPGEGAEYPGMSAELHERCAPYRRALAVVDEAMAPHLGGSVRDLLFAGDDSIHRPERARPGLFAVAYALGRTLRELGVAPAWLLGQGIGEYAAAALAGVFDLADACRLVVAANAGPVTCHAPGTPVYSARGGGALGDEALDPAYWGAEPTGPDRLSGAIEAAARDTPTHVIELGPAMLTPRVTAATGGRPVPGPVPAAGSTATGGELLDLVAALYRDGLTPLWEALYEPDQRVPHRLTPYEFSTSARFWMRTTVSGRDIVPAPPAHAGP
jgi:acyl transferase domain-containing protein